MGKGNKAHLISDRLVLYVVALYDYDPTNGEFFHKGEPHYAAPAEATQLKFKRGEKFEVLTDKLDWWIYCRSLQSGQEGYVSTELMAPVFHMSTETVEW